MQLLPEMIDRFSSCTTQSRLCYMYMAIYLIFCGKTHKISVVLQSIVYWGSAKNRYQMEIPEIVAKKVPDEYNLMSSKKGWKRYRTDEIEKLLSQMMDAEDRKDTALRDVMRRIFYSFDERYM